MNRQYFVAPEDIPKGAYVPIEYNNPNLVSIRTCNGCGITIGDDDVIESEVTYHFSLGEMRHRQWWGHFCYDCKTGTTLAQLEARIINGTVK